MEEKKEILKKFKNKNIKKDTQKIQKRIFIPYSKMKNIQKKVKNEKEEKSEKEEKKIKSPVHLSKALENKFDAIDNSTENKFDAIDNRFTSIENKFDAIDNRFNSADNIFNNIVKIFSEIREDVDFLTENLIRKCIASKFSKKFASPFIIKYLSDFVEYFLNILSENSYDILKEILNNKNMILTIHQILNNLESQNQINMKNLGKSSNEFVAKMAYTIRKSFPLIKKYENEENEEEKNEYFLLFEKSIENEIMNIKLTDQFEINISGSLEIIRINENQIFVKYKVGEVKKRLGPLQLGKGLKQLLRTTFFVYQILSKIINLQCFSCDIYLFYSSINEKFKEMLNDDEKYGLLKENNILIDLFLKKIIY